MKRELWSIGRWVQIVFNEGRPDPEMKKRPPGTPNLEPGDSTSNAPVGGGSSGY